VWAMQDQEEAWPKWARAILESESPFSTVIVVAARTEEIAAGRSICEPASMWLASRMFGLAASSSCQRRPWPRFCSASFHNESPCFTITTLRFFETVGAILADGRAGAIRADGFAGATGATGRGVARLGGAGREERMRGGAESKMLGRSNGERFTGGRNGVKRGGADLTNGGATGDSNGSGG
jgi:hypothetical protein